MLAPFVDIANHAPTHADANAKVQELENGDVALVAARPIKEGEEVQICYGEYTNEQLLFSYGFVLPGTPNTGPVCPWLPPKTQAHTSLLRAGLEVLRSRECGADGAGLKLYGAALPFPCLRARSGCSAALSSDAAGDPAQELLLALRVQRMLPEEASEALCSLVGKGW